MAAFSWAVGRFRVFLGMGKPPLEIVAYSSGSFFPFRLKQNSVEAALAARLPNVPTQAPTIRRDVERSLPDRPAEPGGEPVRRQAHGIAKGDTPASSPKGE